MTKTSSIITSFKFIGKLSKISDQQKKIKYLKLTTEAGKYWIKIPRQLRKQLPSLSLGCELEVQGKIKQDLKTGKTKYKAQMVVIIAPETLNAQIDTKLKANKSVSLLPVLNDKSKSKPQAKAKAKSKVLICHKSNCWKKGGQEVCAAIESILKDHNLTQEISIKQTGCLNQCKKAPALIMMPDKARYQNVRPKQVGEIVKKHLIAR
ncbi:MAG: (2Fe-2S) ferredoxin domain-containing protein [Waterburya sp.]